MFNNRLNFPALFLTTLFWCAPSAAEMCKNLIITGPPQSPPASWIQDGKMIGSSVEFVEKIALAAGVQKVEKKVFGSWREALDAARLGHVDLIFSTAFSTERERFLNYVYPHYTGQNLYVVVRKGEAFPLLKYDDLIGRKGAAGEGEAYGNSVFEEIVSKKLSIVRMPTINDSLDYLFDKKVDYILAYQNVINSTIFSKDLLNKVEIILTYPFFAETYIAMSKRSKCSDLAKVLSSEIRKAERVNQYFFLSSKYNKLFEMNTIVSDNSQ